MTQYTLRITDHNDNVVLEIGYEYYSRVKETAELLARGTTQDHSMAITIFCNATKREIWSTATLIA